MVPDRIKTDKAQAAFLVDQRYGDQAVDALRVECLAHRMGWRQRRDIQHAMSVPPAVRRHPIRQQAQRNRLPLAEFRRHPRRAPFVRVAPNPPLKIIVKQIGPVRFDKPAQLAQRNYNHRIHPVERQADVGG